MPMLRQTALGRASCESQAVRAVAAAAVLDEEMPSTKPTIAPDDRDDEEARRPRATTARSSVERAAPRARASAVRAGGTAARSPPT